MNLALLLPGALAALLALAVPLLLHLARRTEQRPTPFAALRWLRRQPRPRRRLRFDDWPLLLVRLLLLALLALWLARPVQVGEAARTHWIAVVPGVDPAAVRADGDEARLHWLLPGFPALDDGQAAGADAGPADASPSSLLRQLDAELPADARLTVFVPEVLDGVDAQRIVLSRQVDWRVVPGGSAAADRVSAAAPPVLQVRHDAAHAPAANWLRAAAQAWRPDDAAPPALGDDASVAPPGDTRSVLVWLRADALPPPVIDWIEGGGTALVDAATTGIDRDAMQVAWSDEAGQPLLFARPLGAGRMLQFARPLTAAAMPDLLAPTFPGALRAQLQPVPEPARVRALDHAPGTGARGHAQPPRDLRPWLAALIALLCVLERWMATARRRVVAS
ncbi:BatA domain-containing protein [Luteimonas sp. BDR2-5]|uniref:BatA domain-containing protein n=1 Tax=Proluteimonas luteida TaxID=2878685 RepID=UPI001E2EFE53|nr:BatA domain-containing protein [Luteimonas sp. BDR2-5]MCD9029235.1 BatA domain-containing protein [Luteimonas sp. BDR2-5]